MLELKNICFEQNGELILNNINLTFEDNKFYVITGPNGSGKSSLAKIIMGIYKPTSGVIIYNGHNITDKSITERAKLGFGYAFQTPTLFKGLTVWELLNIAKGKKISKKEACTFLSQVGLCAQKYLDRELNKSLSGGELKRIEIASIIAKNPAIAIFDEPEAGIDLWSFEHLTKIFKDMVLDKTTIVISHQERILKMADKVILLDKGTVKEVKKEDFLTKIANKECAKGE